MGGARQGSGQNEVFSFPVLYQVPSICTFNLNFDNKYSRFFDDDLKYRAKNEMKKKDICIIEYCRYM